MSFHRDCLGFQDHSTGMPIVVVEVVVAIDMEPTIVVEEPASPNIIANLSVDFTAASSLRFLPTVAAVFHDLVYAIINWHVVLVFSTKTNK